MTNKLTRRLALRSSLMLAVALIIPFGLIARQVFTPNAESSPAAKSAGEIDYEVHFPLDEVAFSEKPGSNPVSHENNGYDAVNLPDQYLDIEPGQYQLPYKVIHFAVDRNTYVSKVELISDVAQDLPGEFDIPVAQQSVEYSEEYAINLPDLPDITTEESPPAAESSPARVELASQGSISGVNIATIQVYPFEYLPAQKHLILHQTIKFRLVLNYKSKPDIIIKRYPSNEVMRDWLKKVVANPENVDRQFGRTEATNGIDYLIITSDELNNLNAFQPLIDDKISRGMTVMVQTVENIRTTYPGRDLQERIRNYIIDKATNDGVVWVLLGGDARIFPFRWTLPTGLVGRVISDLYYSDLDGTWDGNNNDIFGEPDDGLDYYPDVFVGRAPVVRLAEAQVFVNKVLTYESNVGGYVNTALFLGAEDYFDAGGRAKDLITQDYLTPEFQVTKYYERDIPCYRDRTLTAINQGYNLINHIDHAGKNSIRTGCDALTTSDINALTNLLTPSIFWSSGCGVADLSTDNIASRWITNPNGGGPAFIGNSAGSHYPQTDQMLDPEFYKSLFIEGYTHIGQTFADSRITFIGLIPEDLAMTHDLLGFNLLGDPEMTIQISE